MATKTTSTAAAAAKAPTAKAADNWMRGLMLILAVQEGFSHSQTSTYVDVLTKKGQAPIVLTWSGASNGHLLAITQGNTHIEGKGSMLQRAQTMLGKPMELHKKWTGMTAGKKHEAILFQHSKVKVLQQA